MATQSSVRISNQELMIEYLMKNGETSRAQLAKDLSISKPTVSLNAEKLLEKELLIETGEGLSSGGRKPTLLNFNYDHKIIVAIDLNRNQPLIALSNLSGRLMFSTSLEMMVTESKPFLIQRLTTAINELIISHAYDMTSLGAISIAVPGVIDDVNDKIFANPQDNLWTDLNLKKVLTEIYHVPVLMKNDISMAALGVKHYGLGKDYDDLLYVSAGHGIGGGIILKGELLEGKRNFAGELGITRLNGDKTLEEQIGSSAIVERIKADIKLGQECKLSLDQPLTLKEIKTAITAGDEYLIEVIKSSANILGNAVANIALILDLEAIVVGGVLSEVGDLFITNIEDRVQQIVPFDVKVSTSNLGQEAGIYGLLVIGKSFILNQLIE